MTIKERRLIRGVVAGKSQTQAAIDAGYSPRSANEQASRALAKDNVRSSLERLMDREGLTERKLLQPIKDGVVATRVVGLALGGTDEMKELEVPDHAIRLKASEQAWKLRGKLLNTTNNNTLAPTQILVVHNYRPSNGHAAAA